MAKLPECERPPFKEIEKRLNDRVSQQYRQLLVQDIQNDCGCEFETFDRDIDLKAWYLDGSQSVKALQYGDRLPVPMLPDISDQDIIALFKAVCDDAIDHPLKDIVPAAVIANPKCDKNKLVHILDSVTKTGLVINRSGVTHGLAFMDFIPEDTFYILPDPEYLGAITVNITGFGAFCFSGNIAKYTV
jgi:hypothetical protein